MPDTITADIAITELRKVVEKFGPDHMVDQCTYGRILTDHNGVEIIVPSCIVGQVFTELGYEISDLNGFDALDYSDVNAVNEKFHVADSDGEAILQVAQAVQDGTTGSGTEKSWGNALKYAENEYRKIKSRGRR